MSTLNSLKLVAVKKTTQYARDCDSPKQVGNQALGANQSGAKPTRWQALCGHEIPLHQRCRNWLASSVATGEELVKALTAIKAAVEAGELDAQIKTASSSLKQAFRK